MNREITVEPWTYRVSPFPAGTDQGRFWCAWIVAIGDGRWHVLEHYNSTPQSFLTVNGEWTMDREASICFRDFDVAKRMAAEAIPEITVNGRTYDEAVAMYERRQGL